ncbi:cellulase family glycosylhydrolase [Actinoallomurus sp. NPDC052308]|uniref:cellulase family glycosylhydrolase n=1 Tax=Actinoallomurus sp. NPDC052308 TaxID=3155530 RepID=UPI003445A856
MPRLSFASVRTGRALAVALAVAAAVAVPGAPRARADGSPAVVVSPAGQNRVFRDGDGRQVTLRGFNVSGGAKLQENGLLPFRGTADAARSAQAMRDLTGANAVRFLISWEGVQPAPDRIDYSYLDRAIQQITAFTDRGFRVLLDYHQDLYSSHLFNSGSWYTGDGAPDWVIKAGNYPKESCGICLLWGQNMQTNAAVRQAAHDFWHDRTLTTASGQVGVQDAFLGQAAATMTYLRQKLPAQAFQSIVGFDPFNEPFDGGLDGQTGLDWEKTYLLPFYQRFRTAMDDAGWAAKTAFVEPLVFWNTGFFEEGGLSSAGPLGTRLAFNTHYYDGARITVDPTPAGDGTYDAAMNEIRQRATDLRTAPMVSEFGNKLSGTGSDRTPWMVRAMYQAMDYGVAGKNWWDSAASAGPVLSGTQWHWDVYSGNHHELMNGNPDKVQTAGDGWNGEDFSVVTTDTAGNVGLRLDARLLDRLYPSAVAGDALAFAYEDLAPDGTGRQQAWLTVPSSLPNVAALVKDRQYGVLVWRGTAGGTTTELHLPRSFAPASTTVVSDLGTLTGVPSSGAVKAGDETGSTTAHRLVLTAPAGVHFALVVNTASGTAVTAAQRAAAATELASWRTRLFPAG